MGLGVHHPGTEAPVDRIWVSVYEDDDETGGHLGQRSGVDPSHIVRLGKEDNFWEIGSGPCGPCSELYFDRGEEYGCGKPTLWRRAATATGMWSSGTWCSPSSIPTGKATTPLWNIPTSTPAWVWSGSPVSCRGVNNLFEVDTVQRIMKHIAGIAGVEYGQDENRRLPCGSSPTTSAAPPL